MPELPEVETITRELRPALTGRTIRAADVYWERSVVPPDGAAFARQIAGRSVTKIGRRGKWIVIALDNEDTLLIHLRMTGQLMTLSDPETFLPRHTRVFFTLDDGKRLIFQDQRKFGRLVLTSDPHSVLGTLGLEPLAENFTVEQLGVLLAGRRRRIKPLLLDQHFLAGLGNIYTDEALWQAGIHPLQPANTLTPDETARLHDAIRAVLRTAIAHGGTTLPDATYRQLDGRPGAHGESLAVYGRAGQACPRCGAEITRLRVAQRGTSICPVCQVLRASPADEDCMAR